MPAGGLTELLRLLWGTVVHRPYVYGFFVCFLAFARIQLGWKKTTAYLVFAYLIALGSELCSTRYGFPFGRYTYIDTMRTQELWISDVPFWDSLSFVFLSYFSWNLAGAGLGKLRALRTYLYSGFAMMLLDVVIDPLTLRGDRWFLGRIYFYPNGGSYFGVTLANFAGWFFVGALIPFAFDALFGAPDRLSSRFFRWGVFGVYAGVLAFNLAITAWIGEWKLFGASSAISFIALAAATAALIRCQRKELSHA